MSTFKYYKNGQWNTVNGAVTGDTLPIGAIVDYDGENVPAGYEVIANPDYSTNETKTGEFWIDGKPIYRKVISGTLPSTSGSWSGTLISNVDTITNTYWTIAEANQQIWYPMQKDVALYRDTSRNLHIQINSDYHKGHPYILVTEYTKN